MSDRAESIVLLHGFAGTRHTWDAVASELRAGSGCAARMNVHAIDLPGHGANAQPAVGISFDSCREAVLAASPGRLLLCGYSMGARIALLTALAAPQRIAGLALVSGSPGIESAQARAERRRADERLARELETEPFERWIARWRDQPLFAEEPAAVRSLALAEHRRNDPLALARALRALGSGRMPSLWSLLGRLQMPVALIAGQRDRRYAQIAERMAAALADASLELLPGGHSLALESPRALAKSLEGLLARLPERA